MRTEILLSWIMTEVWGVKTTTFCKEGKFRALYSCLHFKPCLAFNKVNLGSQSIAVKQRAAIFCFKVFDLRIKIGISYCRISERLLFHKILPVERWHVIAYCSESHYHGILFALVLELVSSRKFWLRISISFVFLGNNMKVLTRRIYHLSYQCTTFRTNVPPFVQTDSTLSLVPSSPNLSFAVLTYPLLS